MATSKEERAGWRRKVALVIASSATLAAMIALRGPDQITSAAADATGAWLLSGPSVWDSNTLFGAVSAPLYALAGPRDALLARFDALHAHTVEHFDQEDRWMAANGFAAENCHASQHAQVLALMREVDRHARELDDLEPMRVLLPELAKWFVQHAQMMDAALAWTMKERGFDPATGRFADPATGAALATAEPVTGCGGGACA